MRTLASILAVALCPIAFAQQGEAPPAQPAPSNVQKPTPDAVKSTWDFFYKGKGGGPVLVDAKPCLEIGKTGDDKSECVKEVPPEGVKAGTLVHLWQAYLLPKDEVVEDLAVQVKLGDVVRETKDVAKLKGEGWRTRTWNGVKLAKPGTWTLSVVRGSDVMQSVTVKAN